MKKLLGIVVLGLFLITPSHANDIRDLEIESMAIGDSLLDYFNKKEIKDKTSLYYKNNKFASFVISNLPIFETYDDVQVTYKPSDNEYKLHSIEGQIGFPVDIKNCYKKMDQMVNDISEFYKEISKRTQKDTWSHGADKTGESKITSVVFYFDTGGGTQIACTDWSDKMTKKNNRPDMLIISIDSEEFQNFLLNEAYE